MGDGATALDEAGGWNDGLYAFEFWCGSWDNPQNITSGPGIALYNLADLSNPSSMSFKFEMCIPSDKPWKAGAMQICFQPVSQVTVSGNPIEGEKKVAKANAYAFNNEAEDLGSWGRALYRPWEATGEFHTDGKWITVTIPITEFNKGYQNGPATSSPSTEKDFASLTMFVLGGGVNGAECAPIIKIDNISLPFGKHLTVDIDKTADVCTVLIHGKNTPKKSKVCKVFFFTDRIIHVKSRFVNTYFALFSLFLGYFLCKMLHFCNFGCFRRASTPQSPLLRLWGCSCNRRPKYTRRPVS